MGIAVRQLPPRQKAARALKGIGDRVIDLVDVFAREQRHMVIETAVLADGAHENLLVRYQRYRQTKGLQSILAGMQFPGAKLKFNMRDPDLVFSERLSLPVKGRRVELLWVPSETDDCIAAWLPDDGILYSGAAFPGPLPDCL